MNSLPEIKKLFEIVNSSGFPVPFPPDHIQWLIESLETAVEALEWIDKPNHYEPDNYTQVACFQHRAYEALKKIKGLP